MLGLKDDEDGKSDEVVSIDQDYDELIAGSSCLPSAYKNSSNWAPGRATPTPATFKVIMAFNDLRRANCRAIRNRNSNSESLSPLIDGAARKTDDLFKRLQTTVELKEENQENMLKKRLSLELDYDKVLEERIMNGLQQLDSKLDSKPQEDSTKAGPSTATKVQFINNTSEQEYDKSFYVENPEMDHIHAARDSVGFQMQNIRFHRRSMSMKRQRNKMRGGTEIIEGI